MAGADDESTPPKRVFISKADNDRFWSSRWEWLNPTPRSHEATDTAAELRKLHETAAQQTNEAAATAAELRKLHETAAQQTNQQTNEAATTAAELRKLHETAAQQTNEAAATAAELRALREAIERAVEPELEQPGQEVRACIDVMKNTFRDGKIPSDSSYKTIGNALGGKYILPSKRTTIGRAVKIFDPTFRSKKSAS